MTAPPLLTVVIATQGRETLPRALQSVRASSADVEIVVVADTHSPLLSDVESTARKYGARYTEHNAGYHDSGHPQAQIGTEAATGRYILYLGDDDEFVPGALGKVAEAALRQPEPRPLMFQAIMHPSKTRPITHPILLWSTPTMERSRVTAQNIVAPNVHGRLGRWGDDFDFIESTAALYGGPESLEWRAEVITVCH